VIQSSFKIENAPKEGLHTSKGIKICAVSIFILVRLLNCATIISAVELTYT
jgi:hypothetical protein